MPNKFCFFLTGRVNEGGESEFPAAVDKHFHKNIIFV